MRRVIYTTNAIENINAQLRKIIKTGGQFPNDDAATKDFWLALRNIAAIGDGRHVIGNHAKILFAILYEDRFVRPAV